MFDFIIAKLSVFERQPQWLLYPFERSHHEFFELGLL